MHWDTACRSMMEQEAEEAAEMDGAAKRGITYQVQWNWLWKSPYLALVLNIVRKKKM